MLEMHNFPSRLHQIFMECSIYVRVFLIFASISVCLYVDHFSIVFDAINNDIAVFYSNLKQIIFLKSVQQEKYFLPYFGYEFLRTNASTSFQLSSMHHPFFIINLHNSSNFRNIIKQNYARSLCGEQIFCSFHPNCVGYKFQTFMNIHFDEDLFITFMKVSIRGKKTTTTAAPICNSQNEWNIHTAMPSVSNAITHRILESCLKYLQ